MLDHDSKGTGSAMKNSSLIRLLLLASAGLGALCERHEHSCFPHRRDNRPCSFVSKWKANSRSGATQQRWKTAAGYDKTRSKKVAPCTAVVSDSPPPPRVGIVARSDVLNGAGRGSLWPLLSRQQRGDEDTTEPEVATSSPLNDGIGKDRSEVNDILDPSDNATKYAADETEGHSNDGMTSSADAEASFPKRILRERIRNIKDTQKAVTSRVQSLMAKNPIHAAPLPMPMPQAIAAIIRDAAELAVENAVHDVVVPAIRARQGEGDHEAGDVDIADVAAAAEAAVERAVAERAGTADAVAAAKVVTDEIASAAREVTLLASDAVEAARVASAKADEASLAAEDAFSKAEETLRAIEALNGELSRVSSSVEVALRPAITTPASTTPTETVRDMGDLEKLTYDEVDYSVSEMAPPFIGEDQCLVPGEAVIRIENAPGNARRIFAGIDIMTSVDEVWKVLTDYDRLQNVVPNLVTNEVIARYDGDPTNPVEIVNNSTLSPEDQCRIMSERLKGARLRQVGGAKVVGINFSARTTLDVREWPDGLPDFAHYGDEVYEGKSRARRASDERSLPLRRHRFPRPFAICSLPHRDISMQSVEGDSGEFRMYQGVWRMQPLPGCAPRGGNAMRLTYAVEISPRAYLPVRLVEGRIAQDLCANLKAIRAYVTPGLGNK